MKDAQQFKGTIIMVELEVCRYCKRIGSLQTMQPSSNRQLHLVFECSPGLSCHLGCHIYRVMVCHTSYSLSHLNRSVCLKHKILMATKDLNHTLPFFGVKLKSYSHYHFFLSYLLSTILFQALLV